MARPSLRIAAACAVASYALALGGCVDNEGVDGVENAEEGTLTPTTGVATPTEEPEAFETRDVPKEETDLVSGERVEDPGMAVSYKWQGTENSPSGGTIVTVAVTNNSDVTMPVDALGDPSLTYGGESATRVSAEDAGLEFEGLDLPLGKGATTNVQYAFDVSKGNLYDAQFEIGNVIFTGNLSN